MRLAVRLKPIIVALTFVLGGDVAPAGAAPPPSGRPAPPRTRVNQTAYAPNLQTALAVIVAGGGPQNFKTTTLLSVLAGSEANREAVRITRRLGAVAFKGAIVTLDFIIAEAVRAENLRMMTFPAAADASDGKALANALYAAGSDASSKTYDVDRMFDRLVRQPRRVKIMRDVDTMYGVTADATLHTALALAMHDLKTQYSLSSP